MTLDELFRLAAIEPARTFEREVRVTQPKVFEELRQRHGMPLTEFLADPRHKFERRTFSEGHVFGPGLSAEQIETWARRWPRHPLPNDLVDLLRRVNGIHLGADLQTGRSYAGLAPLEEWDLARKKMYGPNADSDLLDDRYLALSYDANSAAFVVLNVESRRYFLMDACGADETSPIGDSVGHVLDWLWRNR